MIYAERAYCNRWAMWRNVQRFHYYSGVWWTHTDRLVVTWELVV